MWSNKKWLSHRHVGCVQHSTYNATSYIQILFHCIFVQMCMFHKNIVLDDFQFTAEFNTGGKVVSF